LPLAFGPARKMPSKELPEIRLGAPGVVPPIVLPGESTSIPIAFGVAVIPSVETPR